MGAFILHPHFCQFLCPVTKNCDFCYLRIFVFVFNLGHTTFLVLISKNVFSNNSQIADQGRVLTLDA